MSSITNYNKNNKRKSVNTLPSPVNSVVSYASTSTLSTSSTISGSSNNNWLPPISTLLSHIHDNTFDYNTPYYHISEPQDKPVVLPKQKKRKMNKPQKIQQQKPVFMPMIPYYFHHEKFGIEACMLQLEGQKKFNNHYYI